MIYFCFQVLFSADLKKFQDRKVKSVGGQSMGPVIKFATFEIYTSEVFNYKFNSTCGSKSMGTLMSQIVEHTEIDEHLGEIAENLIVEHLFYTISIVTNNRTPGIFFTAWIVKRVWLHVLWTPEYWRCN